MPEPTYRERHDEVTPAEYRELVGAWVEECRAELARCLGTVTDDPHPLASGSHEAGEVIGRLASRHVDIPPPGCGSTRGARTAGPAGTGTGRRAANHIVNALDSG